MEENTNKAYKFDNFDKMDFVTRVLVHSTALVNDCLWDFKDEGHLVTKHSKKFPNFKDFENLNDDFCTELIIQSTDSWVK